MTEPEVIPSSTGKKRVLVLVAIAVCAVGLGLMLWYNPLAVNAPFGMLEQRPFFLGCFLLLGGVVTLPIALVRVVRRRGLRITPESLQLVSLHGGLVGNLPDSNIARMELAGEDAIPTIRIWLQDPSEPQTFWSGGWLARWWTRRESGCDVTLGPSWVIPVVDLFRRLDAKYAQIRERDADPSLARRAGVIVDHK